MRLGSLYILNEVVCESVVFITLFVTVSPASQRDQIQTDTHGAHFLLGPMCNKKGEERRVKRGLNCTLAPWEFTTQVLEGSTCQECLHLHRGCVSNNVISDGDFVHILT